MLIPKRNLGNSFKLMFKHPLIQTQVPKATGIEFQLDMQLGIMQQEKKKKISERKKKKEDTLLDFTDVGFSCQEHDLQQQDKACDACLHGNLLKLTYQLSQQGELDQTNFDTAFIRQLNCIQNDTIIFVCQTSTEEIKIRLRACIL